MSILASPRQTTRFMIYTMICTLVIAFGTIGAVLAESISPPHALMGLFLGSALGAFISVYESTIIGCMAGMITGLVISPLIYFFIDLETAFLMVFVMSLFGAIMGEPIVYFWREAKGLTEEYESEETKSVEPTASNISQNKENREN